MDPRLPRISLAELSAAGVCLTASEAATIARELILRASRGELPGLPSPHVIRLTEDGGLHVEGPIASDLEIPRAARLVEALLPGFDAPVQLRVPGALRLALARALRILDLPPYTSLAEFADALTRFAAPDAAATLRDIAARWRSATTPLTISDIRRARRATRLTLAEISERTRIPAEFLREFEWGYFEHWPAGTYGRTQIVRYARAAGLDEGVVVAAALPLLDQWERRPVPVVDAVPVADGEATVGETHLVKTTPAPLVMQTRPVRRAAWAAAIAIPAMLAIGVLPAIWNEREPQSPAPVVAKETPVTATATPRTKPAAPPAVTPGDVAFSPAFASSGSAMFYHSGTGARSAILRADTDPRGTVLRVTRVIADGASNFHARPSPDGESIAFDSDRHGVRAVYLSDADGNNVRRVSGEGFAAIPSWSPDGSRLAFVRAEPGRPRVWNIWVLDLETGDAQRVTDHRIGQPWGAAWFPSGDRIAYSHEQRLIVRDLDGGNQRVFNTPVRGRLVRTPAVSPDGRRVVFQVQKDGAWMLDLQTRRMRRILADPTSEEFTWSPDGRRIAFHSRHSGTWGIRQIGD